MWDERTLPQNYSEDLHLAYRRMRSMTSTNELNSRPTFPCFPQFPGLAYPVALRRRADSDANRTWHANSAIPAGYPIAVIPLVPASVESVQAVLEDAKRRSTSSVASAWESSDEILLLRRSTLILRRNSEFLGYYVRYFNG